MLSQEILHKIRHLELQTKRILAGNSAGDYMNHTRGSGFEFDQLRDYEQGDDVRFIDWKSSARTNKLLIRQYKEERNRTVVILIDCSASSFYGSSILKYDVMAELGAVIAFASQYNKDYVGLVLFNDVVQTVVPAAGGQAHCTKIVQEIFSCPIQEKSTSLATALTHVLSQYAKSAFVVIISDFLDNNYQPLLKTVASRHTLIALRVADPYEVSGGAIGMMQLQDSESSAVRDWHGRSEFSHAHAQQNICFAQCGINVFDVVVGSSWINDLIYFFMRSHE